MIERLHQILQRALNREVRSAVRSLDLAGADIDCLDGTENTHPRRPTNGIYIGGAGDLKVQLLGDNHTTLYVGLLAGTFAPIAAVKVYTVAGGGTSATNVKLQW